MVLLVFERIHLVHFFSHLTLLARLRMHSSPTTDRSLVETMDVLFGETYTDMLGCSMSRSSMGLASAVAPSAVKQGGGVTNQLSSMQPLSEPSLLLPPFPPHSLPGSGDIDGVEEGVDSLTCLGRLIGVTAPKCIEFVLKPGGTLEGSAEPRTLCVLRRLFGGRHSVLVCAFGCSNETLCSERVPVLSSTCILQSTAR